MNESNPYEPTKADTVVASSDLLRAVAIRLRAYRDRPPTVLASLWPGTVLLLFVGIAGTVLLAVVTARSNGIFTSLWPVGFGAMFFGAVLRDLGLAMRITRLWPAQAEFIDFEKVDEFLD